MRLVYSHKTVPAEYCFLPHCALLSSKHNLWERLTPMNHTMCYAHPSRTHLVCWHQMFIWWRGPFQKMNGGGAEEVRILEKRAHIQNVCAQLRQSFPSIPLLRNFQVGGKHPSTWYRSQWGQFQADIIACAVDHKDPSHILSCLPTGYGKSIPMLLLSLFLPPGMTFENTEGDSLKCSPKKINHQGVFVSFGLSVHSYFHIVIRWMAEREAGWGGNSCSSG